MMDLVQLRDEVRREWPRLSEGKREESEKW